MELFKNFSKLDYFLLFLILFLGIFIRFYNFNEAGYINDDMATIPTALLWFYPHGSYPGLSAQGEPALSNFFIGLGCMLSGEDFSKVTQIQPMFYPGRSDLIGREMVNADVYCHLPIYIFSLLFFLIISLLALLLLDKYSALFSIAFFAFFQIILHFSNVIHAEIFLYFFTALGLLFLWLAYSSLKYSFKELIFFILSFISFSLAFATKLPAAIFAVFAAFIFLEKYSSESLSILKFFSRKLGLNQLSSKIQDKETNFSSFFKIIFFSILAYVLALLPPFEFNLKNIFSVLAKYRVVNPTETGLFSLNSDFLRTILRFIYNLNILDVLLFLFSLFLIIVLIKKRKSLQEKFILYLCIFSFLTLIFFNALNFLRVFVVFSFGLIFLMSLAFSSKNYSLLNFFKNKKLIFTIFILIYVVYSFSLAFAASPYFMSKNKVLCSLANYECDAYSNNARLKADFLKSFVGDDETFITSDNIVYFYFRQEESLPVYLFTESFKKQTNKVPTIQDYMQYFSPDNRKVRYYVTRAELKADSFGESGLEIKENFKPNKVFKLKNKEVDWVYDLYNLEKG